MCGIVGICRASGPAQDLEPLLRRMCRSMTHRGPDDEGYHIEGPVALGMRRLSVIDLETGRQPIRNEDGAVSVVFNGEIYNFRELRRELIGRGHVFRTAGDTEVIVHLYEELGEHCVTPLRGMFAIAVWDRARQRLLLARDRLGVKPLFYRSEPERLVFGSEIKSILQDPQIPRDVDYEALDEMLRLGYTMPPRTSFAGISELPPGSILSYEAGEVRVERYWSLDYTKRGGYDERAALDELRERLTESIRLRMIADVPLGALLSGGVDSTVIVALMAGLSDRPVKTFSIGFEDAAFSELPLARQVAERYETEHHEYVVQPDVIELLPSLVRHHDTPFYDSSALPTWHVCRMARSEVTVALSGDGGDELFAGYNLYRADRAARFYGRLPGWLSNGLLRPLSRLLPETGGYTNLGRVAREFTAAGSAPQIERYRRWTSKLKLETRQELYLHPELLRALQPAARDHIERLFGERASDGALDRLLYVDTQTELAQDVLVKVDRMSMASSLEVRSPLLDHTLHEFAAGLPEQAKLHGRTTKVLLRRLARDLLPRELLDRSKRGFMVPLDRWFRENLREYAREILLDSVTLSRGLFDPDAVERLLERHTSGRRAHGRDIWNLLTVELWHRQYIDTFDRL